MPKTSCEPQVNRPRTRRSARRENPYHNKKNQDKKDDPSNISLMCEEENGKVENESNKLDFNYSDDPDEDLITPDINKPFNCFICDGRERDGRNLNMNKKLYEARYHLAMCYYKERKFLNIIDAGPLNRNQDGFPIDEIGSQFKYRCPFPTCPRNTNTRGGQHLFGFKAYSLHLAREHHLLEVILASESRAGAAEVRAAIIQARRREGGLLERVPEVQFEEVHICLVCNGENKEGKNLSFDPNKISSLRYHYASCFYDTGVYLLEYSEALQLDKIEEHKQNMGEDGKPKEVLGAVYKYTCQVKKCSARSRRTMGLKEYCIHTANEHGVVIQIMLNSEREDLRKVGIRLKAIFG